MNQPNDDPPTSRPKRRMIWTILLLVGLVILVPVFVSLSQVEDWSRDLSQNRAETSLDAADQSLRTIETDIPVDEALAAVRRAAADLPRWSEAPDDPQAPPGTLALVHTTALVRYQDDVVITVSTVEGKTHIKAVSQSRVGRGDFGQNPRNLREILAATRAELESMATP